MTQADKIIKVVVVVVALVCVGLVTNEYWPQITKYNKWIAQSEGSQRAIARHTKSRAKSLSILIFGNFGILAIAIGLNLYLTGKKED